jgi:NAD(P)-dependent dehydrogenase (short-subunit alcohol dehydrogenase family)
MSTTDLISRPAVALVTGGSRGLGRATALALAKDGSGVILTYLSNRAAAAETVAEIAALGQKAVALKLDAGDTSTFAAFAGAVKKALADTWGAERFTALVNNAGTGKSAPFMQTTEADFDQLVNVHLKGVYFLTQTLVPLLADGGRIVNISSGLTRFSFPGSSAYAAMKGAIEVLTRYLAVELGARGIAVNTFAPGAIATDFNGGTVRDNENVNKHVASVTALGRVGLPGDIGPAIASLLSNDNRWINAQRIEASGGMML